MKYNLEKAGKLKDTARRTINIIDMLLGDATSGMIVRKIGAERSLVDYYKKAISNETKNKNNS